MNGEVGMVRVDGRDITAHDLEEDQLQNVYWRSKEGNTVNIQHIADSYLRNIALMLIGMGYSTYHCTDRNKVLWLSALRLEWERRMKLKEDGDRMWNVKG